MVFPAVPLDAGSGCCAGFLSLNNTWGLSAGSEVYTPLAVHTACAAKAVPWPRPRQRPLHQKPAVASSNMYSVAQHTGCQGHGTAGTCVQVCLFGVTCYVNTSTKASITPEERAAARRAQQVTTGKRTLFHGPEPGYTCPIGLLFTETANKDDSRVSGMVVPQCLAAPGAPPWLQWPEAQQCILL